MSRDWREPTVLELVRRHRGREPEAIIDAYVAKRLKDAGQTAFPIDVEGIASLLGIRRRRDSYPFAGRIYAEPSGQLVMDLNHDDYPRRQRFTCAHEIMHTAFPGFTKEHRYRSDVTTGAYDVRNEEEYLCDRGAASLLLPESIVRDTADIDDGLDAVEALSSHGDVSLEAAINRLIHLADRPCLALVLEIGTKPADRAAARRGESVVPRLRVRYGRASQLDVFVPRYKSAADDSLFVRTIETGERQKGRTYLPGAEKHGLFDVECGYFPYGQQDRVIAVARPTRQSD